MLWLLAAAFVAAAGADVVAPPADPSDTTMKLRGPLVYKYETLEHPADEYANSQQLGQNNPFPKCPRGKYATALLTTDGCIQCPKGKYGRAAPPLVGAEGDFCTLCKPGRFRDTTGAVDDEDCLLCPIGTYGSAWGLKTKACSGTCSEGRYSPYPGITSKSQCYECPDGYHSNTQCLREDRFEDKDSRRRRLAGEGSVASEGEGEGEGEGAGRGGEGRSRAGDVATLDELELEADELEAERLGLRD